MLLLCVKIGMMIWLPECFRKDFKLLLVTFKALHGCYISDLLVLYVSFTDAFIHVNKLHVIYAVNDVITNGNKYGITAQYIC